MADFWMSLDSAEKLYIIVILAILPITILGIFASINVNATFRRYQKVTSSSGMTASQAARRMLDDEGLTNVSITRVAGRLTDHFDPRTNTIALSDAVYSSTSIGAIGVALHEAGHAIQHSNGYIFSKIRLALVPVVNFSNRLFFPIMLIGILFGVFVNSTFGTLFVVLGVVVFFLTALFSLITLPTEFDASSRALECIKYSNAYPQGEIKGAKKVLKAAALTYVVAFLASLLQFLRFLAMLLMMMNKRRR